MTSYKPSPQARYLVAKMAELEQNLVAAVNKLSMKIDSYDKRITTLKSDISKVRSQVDLSMRSIQALQKELVLLLHTMNTQMDFWRIREYYWSHGAISFFRSYHRTIKSSTMPSTVAGSSGSQHFFSSSESVGGVS
jgi:hypothetical protein